MINDANIIPIGRVPTYTRAIKIGNRVFPLTVYTSTSGGTSFYKCAAVYGPYDVETVVISGCPVADANGEYLPTDQTTSDWEGKEYPIYANGKGWYYGYSEYGGYGITQDFNNGMKYQGQVGSTWYDWDMGSEISGMTAVKTTVTFDAEVPKTWDGYKAVFADGVYSFEETATVGLSYSVITPKNGKIYTADALAEIKNLYNGSDPTMVFYAPLSEYVDNAETGQSISYTGEPSFNVIGGIPCVSNSRILINDDNSNFPVRGASRTLSGWVRFIRVANSWTFAFGAGGDDTNTLSMGGNEGKILCYSRENSLKTNVSIEANKWYHLLATYDGTTLNMYINGILSGTQNKTLNTENEPGVYVGYLATQSSYDFDGYVSAVRLYNRVLTDSEIAELASEFTPTA